MRERQIKLQWNVTIHPLQLLKLKRLIPSVDDNWNYHTSPVRKYNGVNTLETSLVKHTLAYSPAIPLKYLIQQKWKHPDKRTYTWIFITALYTIDPPPVEIIQVFINWCKDKQILVYQYNGILVFHKKQSATETIKSWRNLKSILLRKTNIYIKF